MTIDGGTGNVYTGRLASTAEEPPPELETLLRWADDVSAGHVEVRANADTDGDATALEELEAAQTSDFESVLHAMDGLPVTIRLLDPPLHEFLPDLFNLTAREASGNIDAEGRVELQAVGGLREVNPMLGTRGVRLGVMRSGIYEMQVRALCRAASNLFERGLTPHVEVMIPLVVDAEELRIARRWVTDVLDEIGHPELASSIVTIGAMIETPRAALTAGALADHADFFSFGTNDLTQMTFAFSRDDVESRLLPAYQKLGVLPANPFAVLDQEGVGELVRIACEAARAAKPGIKLGVCREHVGHPESVDFMVRLGVDSVSCSPFRIPLARLGVAQALPKCGRITIADATFHDPHPHPTDPDISGDPDDSGDPTDAGGPDVLDVDEALVLHVLRLRGFVTADGFIESLGAHPAELLEKLIESGHARYVETRGIYALLPLGKELHATVIESLSDSAGDQFAEPYREFLEINTALKTLCTTWQMRGDVPNDHTDAAYDQRCIDELSQIKSAAEPVIGDLATTLPRLIRYKTRLGQATEQLAAGNQKMFTGVACGSFHDIWMELHEDLILLQQIDRTDEQSF